MSRQGFTLVEVLIVVVILAILAMIVIPQITGATADSRNSALASDLARTRRQIELFKAEHQGCPPQIEGIWVLLTSRSDTSETATSTPSGTRTAPTFVRPANPINGKTAISSAALDSTAGWYYSATSTTYTIYARDLDGTMTTAY